MVTTLATVATHFLDRPGLSKSTIKSYELTLLPLLQQYGQAPINSLNRQQLEQYLNSLNHLSHTTRKRHQAIIQSLLNFAVEQGYLSFNPISCLKRCQPKQDKGEHDVKAAIRHINPQQLKILYSLLEPNSRLHTLVLLLHRTGVRISEALALDLQGIDRVNRQFSVLDQSKQQRCCFYSEDLEQVLEKYLRLYRHSGSPALFTAQNPFSLKVTRLSYRAAYEDWSRAVQHSELKGFRLHDLRHTFAIERVELMGIEELQSLMGHTNIQSTLRYQKVKSSLNEKAAKKALKVLTEN